MNLFWLGFGLLLAFTGQIHCQRWSCYLNASLPLSPNMTFYPNTSFESCRCLILQQPNMFAFQYDHQQRSCYTMRNIANFSTIRITWTSLLCWYNRTSTTTVVVTTALPSAPITHNTSVGGNNYYTTEAITITNTIPLTSFSVTINVPKTLGASYPTAYQDFWSNTVAINYSETWSTIQYNFDLIQGNSIVPGTWSMTAQFSLTGSARSTANDTYTIRIDSYQTIHGHF